MLFRSRILLGWNEHELLQKNMTPSKKSSQRETTESTRQLVAEGKIVPTIIPNIKRGSYRTLGPGAKALAVQYGIKESTIRHYGTARFLVASEEERQRLVVHTRPKPYVLKKKLVAQNAL